MLPTVWLKPGVLILYGAAFNTASHKHHAMQFVWPEKQSLCLLDGREITAPFIINSQIDHRLHMESGWVLLAEPQSDLGYKFLMHLEEKPVVRLAELADITVARPKQSDNPAELLAPLFSFLDLNLVFTEKSMSNSIADNRVKKLLDELDSCLLGDCQKPVAWRASDVASQMALSESRFLHLFREEMSIAWRPYLLWRRAICAINAITKGQSATDAAHSAGFSDSAHLSRTFRSLFGISIREAKSMFKPR
ncbi:helix-turn-helix domain-containing protein [Candidatus Pelagadaptatus aseana]|uniref:helix-turn-helix domain-containing protein n=1 Tax=Candidatus Pelagadaptatus aseana TaxID=3120508 RepID=UPI003C6F3370